MLRRLLNQKLGQRSAQVVRVVISGAIVGLPELVDGLVEVDQDPVEVLDPLVGRRLPRFFGLQLFAGLGVDRFVGSGASAGCEEHSETGNGCDGPHRPAWKVDCGFPSRDCVETVRCARTQAPRRPEKALFDFLKLSWHFAEEPVGYGVWLEEHMDANELLSGDFEQIQVLRDPSIGLIAFIVVHNTSLGPAFGGIRRWSYRKPTEALADAMRLAEAMTLKCAISGIPGGGGKAVILQHDDLDRGAAYRRIGEYVEQMGGRYFTGPDVGTEPADLDIVAKETEFVARPGEDGCGNLAIPTALGVFSGIEAVADRLGFDGLSGVRVAVQGLGEVGIRLVELLHGAGARLTVTDVRKEVVDIAVDKLGVEAVDPGEITRVEADIFAPCALGGVIHDLSLERLRVRAVAGSANNVLAAPAMGEELSRRGILYAPDFVINSGALIHGALYHLEGQVPPEDRIRKVGSLVGKVIDEARNSGEPPERVAEAMAGKMIGTGTPYFPGGDRSGGIGPEG